jgi:hypothetical protein
MDRQTALENLARAEGFVALGAKHIADQERRLTRLHGDNLARAEELLRTFRDTQILHEDHVDRLRRELARARSR